MSKKHPFSEKRNDIRVLSTSAVPLNLKMKEAILSGKYTDQSLARVTGRTVEKIKEVRYQLTYLRKKKKILPLKRA